MDERGVRRLPVIDATSAPVGMVTRGDSLKAYQYADQNIRQEISAGDDQADRAFGQVLNDSGDRATRYPAA